ncbi:MAG: DUF1013 domain-containing protein [Alphaproteobacteria bacterium]|nr:DUF1013 domain-containing protein [Alphaproteobacteria bacterium]
MALPLMPKATAVWLIENTSLTFGQIADFCGLHILEIQAIANEESAGRLVGLDPVASSQLTLEEIKRCEQDPSADLEMRPIVNADTVLGKKRGRYTPVSKRQDRPDAIAWLLKYYPDMTELQICRLLGTTKPMIKSIKGRTHWNSANIKPKSPLLLGLCTQVELDQATHSLKEACA